MRSCLVQWYCLCPHPSHSRVPSGCLRSAPFPVPVLQCCLTETNSPYSRISMTNIFVGNLSYQTTQDELFSAFSAYGNVERVSIVTDRDSGQPRGFAFVEMTEA